MKSIAVVYMAHDGFASLYSGVGTVARDFLQSFQEVSRQIYEEYPKKAIRLDLYVATMKLNDRSFALSERVRNETLAIVAKHTNIHFVELNNGSGALDAYGTYENWQYASVSGATFLNMLAPSYDTVLAITVDTPFAQVANRFLDTYDMPNVACIWLPQSTVKIHGYGMSSEIDQQGTSYVAQRYAWEKGVIDLAKRDHHVRIGCVGEFMRQHLIDAYEADPAVLVSIRNSLYLPRLSKNIHTQGEIRRFLEKHHIPTNRPLLFSFGRAEPYKGLDLVLKNVGDLIAKHHYFVVVFAAPYSKDDPYLRELKSLAAKYPDDCAVYDDMDFSAPHYLMQWQHTNILAVLSRAEPFGLIPIEARFYNNPALTLVVSDQGGLTSQVEDGVDGFVTGLGASEIRTTFARVVSLSSAQKQHIAEKGKRKVMDQYNQVNINKEVIGNYVS